jgi:hypothetical protein
MQACPKIALDFNRFRRRTARTYHGKTAAVRIQLNDVKQKITAERLASAGDRIATSA